MGTIILILLTEVVATVSAAVMLIQMGGWLPLLVAIILLLSTMLNVSILVCSGLLDASRKAQQQKGGKL